MSIKFTILLLVFASYCMAVNPGVSGFIKTSFLIQAKDSFWPKVQPLLRNISDPTERKVDFTIGTVTLSNLKFDINAQADNVAISTNPTDGLQLTAGSIPLYGSAVWSVKVLFVTISGGLTIDAKVNKLSSQIKLTTTSVDGKGLTPQINFQNFNINLADVHISVINSILAPFVNPLAAVFGGWITDILLSMLSGNGTIKNLINTEANKSIRKVYPKAIPINEIGIAISTYVTGDFQYFTNGIQIPLDGIAYNIATGYQPYGSCATINDPTDRNTIQNDLHLALGECSVKTAIDALIAANFSTRIQISETVSLNLLLGLAKWDKETITFTNGKLTIGVGLKMTGTLSTYKITGATANAVVELSIQKKAALHKICENTPNSRFLAQANKSVCPEYSKEFAEQFASISQSESIATYNIKIKIMELINVDIEGIPNFLVNIFKGLLIGKEIDRTLSVPQICFADDICLTAFDAALNEGFIGANANVALKLQ